MRESQRAGVVQAPVIPLVAELIRAHSGTISLGQGVVHYPPPPGTFERIPAFLADPENHKYKPVDGLPSLKNVLSEKLARKNRIPVGPENKLFVTAGGNMAFVHALMAIADPGDEIVLLTPYYFNHEMAIRLANCVPICVATDHHFQPVLENIRSAISQKTRAVVTVSPNNPTGAVYSEQTLRSINALCRERGVFHISDEAYEDFVYGSARHFSPASITGATAHTISLYSLSKSHGFASWRIGYMLVPAELASAVNKIQDTTLICPPVISQFAAEGAISTGANYVRERIESIAAVRERALAELQSIPEICEIPNANGALYFFPRINSSLQPMELVERLIREHRVAVMPGDAFGASGCCLRVSFGALKPDTISEGIGRLVSGLRSIVTK